MTDCHYPIIVISGLSGSGKSIALSALEDLSFYCVDNLPGGLLADLLGEVRAQPQRYPKVAIGIDARTGPDGLDRLIGLFDAQQDDARIKVLFLDAAKAVLIRRFSETRRRHPLGGSGGLAQTIERERKLLEPLRSRSDWIIDTSDTNVHQLRRRIWRTLGAVEQPAIQSLVIESFAYKKGVPRDVDLVFDARGLANPHWEPELRARTGLDVDVARYLESQDRVAEFVADVLGFVQRWLPALAEDQRSLLTVAIGCTGGQHRSVYVADRIGRALREAGHRVVVAHRELET